MKGKLCITLVLMFGYIITISCMSLSFFHMSCPVHPTPRELMYNHWHQNLENAIGDVVTLRVFQCANATANLCNETANQIVEIKQDISYFHGALASLKFYFCRDGL